MLLYKFDGFSKEYLGYFEAYIDPLESIKQQKNVYVHPPYTTELCPPELKEGYIILFKDGQWVEVEDHRGTKVWDKNGNSSEITELGPIPDGYSLERIYSLKEVRDSKNEEIGEAYCKEYNKEVEVKGVEVKVESAINLRRALEAFEEFGDFSFNGTILTVEDAKYVIKYLYVRDRLLFKRKKELTIIVNKSKDKEEIKNLEIDFPLDVEQYMSIPIEELSEALV